MALHIHALDRGGWSVHGGTYDARANAVILQSPKTSEAQLATITFNENISSMAVTSGGISATTPSLSSATATTTLTGLDTGGYVELLATLASGDVRRLVISASPIPLNRCCDYALC